MAKALFFSLPLRGHVNPSLPLVRGLTARGNEIVYYSSELFAPEIERTGATFRGYGAAALGDLTHLARPATDRLSWLLMRTAATVLETELDRIRAERPDYVITDSVAPWGQWIGEILGVPVVTSVTTFAFNRKVLAYGVARGIKPKGAAQVLTKLRHIGKAYVLSQRLRRRFGARGPGVIGSVIGHSELNIVYTSRYFQPCADAFDERYEFVGPMISRTEPSTLAWERIEHPVIVYVSLGTLFNDDVDFYRKCFAAFEGEDFQVVMATGANVSMDAIGAPPPNAIVRPHVPQLEVLERASAFVTHGGMNSVSESLYYGVPLVVVPQMGEQAVVARRVEELGAGIFVDKEEATAETLRASVRRVLADDRFRRQATVIRQSFLEAGGVARAADAIGRFTGAREKGDASQEQGRKGDASQEQGRKGDA